jgi:amino acid adenylation domain-containing protein
VTALHRPDNQMYSGRGPQAPVNYSVLPQFLTRAARNTPQHIAIIDGQVTLTYDELASRVHRLANHLIDVGCSRGTRIATLIPRSHESLVAQCAIMAAGAVYVPLDPAYPQALLTQLLNGADIAHLITSTRGLGALLFDDAQQFGVTVLDETLTAAVIAEASSDPPDVALNPSDHAYILHTSGTTGRPKGVLVTHRAAVNAVEAWHHHYPQHPITGFLMVSPLTFDGSIGGIWWTVAGCGTLVLAPTDVAELVATVRGTVENRQCNVSHTFITPTLYTQALQDIHAANTTLKQVIIGGEACPEALVRAHHQLMPSVDLVNIYGPTETTVWATTALLKPNTPVSVGQPLANVEIVLVDAETGEPANTGEVCIAGAQISEGYVNDPELTAAKFVPHPGQSGRVMYRSGDLGSWGPDGTLSLGGRIDDQVQIRGQRVELAGIREQLGQLPGVADIVVSMRNRVGDRGQKAGSILTAYVVPAVLESRVDDALRSTWEQIYNDLAAESDEPPTFDTTGWNSSYTGAPLSTKDMAEWVAVTAALMRENDPGAVLDLGCGTGMPLFKVAPHCDRYIGLDPSGLTIANVAAAVRDAGLEHVQVQVGVATDVEHFAGQDFDLVVCNSVTQYFPGIDYQSRLLQSARNAVGDGGRVVFGDVRDLSLQKEFHSAVVQAQARPGSAIEDLAARARRRIAEDREFVIDPRWFARAVAGKPDAVLEVRPRRGRHHNEMTAFRFDAIIHCGSSLEPVELDRWYDWTADNLNLDALRKLLAAPVRSIGLRAVPNARTQHAIAAAAQFFGEESAISSIPCTESATLGVEPEDFFEVAEEHGYQCHLSRLHAHPGGAFDVALLRPEGGSASGRRRIPVFGDIDATVAEQPLATEPRRHQFLATARTVVVPELRRHAAQHLPSHERPEAYVVLSTLPVTANGKVDLHALPAPDTTRPELSTPYRPPLSPTESAIAQVWSDVLGIEKVGTADEFTELGGDSLQAARVAILLSGQLNTPMTAGSLMAAGTIRRLASDLVRRQPIPASVAPQTGNGEKAKRLPLTEVQNIFWLLDHYARPGSARDDHFIVPAHYHILGELDVAALSEAVDQLVARHEALRVLLLLDAADGAQEVTGPTSGWLAQHHVATVSGEVWPPADIERRGTAPDTRSGNVFIAELFTAAPREHVLALEVHHMVSDAWSMGIIEEELTELYAAIVAGRRPQLEPAPSYSDAVLTNYEQFTLDLEWKNTPRFQRAIDYWAPVLNGVNSFQLPSVTSRAQRRAAGLSTVVLTAAELNAVLTLTRANRGTIFTTVLSCLAHLLSTDTGNPDPRLLSINGARDSADTERLIGFVANPFLIRFEPDAEATFDAEIAAVANAARNAFIHSDIPLLALCEEVPELVDVLVDSDLVIVESIQDTPGISLVGCDVRRVDFLQPEFTGVRPLLPSEMVVVIRQEGDQLRLAALYDTSALEAGYVHGLIARLRQLLVAGASEPDQRVGNLIDSASRGTRGDAGQRI